MSLRVWLPLNGDLRNNGLDNITVTNNGATVDNNGKIGKCYSFDGSNDKITLTNLPNPSNISVAFWMKRSANTGTRQFMFTAWYGITCELTTSGNVHCYVAPTHGVCTSPNAITIDNGWIHVAYTFQNKVGGKLYINGNLVKSTDSSDSISWNTTTGNLGYFSTYFNGKLNDFRIYDHVLSAKEVKELSKGLVLHYKLDNGSFGGQDNIYDFQSVASKWLVEEGTTRENYTDSVYGNVVKVISSSGNKRIYRNVSNVWTQGQKYAVSFLAKADSSCVCDMSRSLTNFTQQFTLTTEWKRYSGVINCTATASGGTLSFRVVTTGVNAYITQIKLEYGEVATAYRPNINDPDYNKLGYNSTIIYDSSGYNRNATKTGNITVNSDSARNSLSTVFPDNTSYISLTNFYPYDFANSYTFSWWGKYNYVTGKMMWGYQNGNRLNLSINGGYYYWNTGDSFQNPFGTISSQTYGDGNWHYFAITGDGTTTKLYIDGEFKSNSKTYKGITGTSLFFNGWDSGTNYKFNGSLSDFRIYATALSADDVKELYQISASIDKSGNVFAYEFKED